MKINCKYYFCEGYCFYLKKDVRFIQECVFYNIERRTSQSEIENCELKKCLDKCFESKRKKL